MTISCHGLEVGNLSDHRALAKRKYCGCVFSLRAQISSKLKKSGFNQAAAWPRGLGFDGIEILRSAKRD